MLIISTNDVKSQYGLILDDPEYLDSLPILILSPVSDGISLPTTVDNSEFIYFPNFIYDQDSTGSCASVASVYYTFTYEINRLRNLPSYIEIPSNLYPPNFPWNFFNTANYSTGSTFGDIWDVLKESGCPNAQMWGNLNPMDYYRWMSGFDNYKAAALNKLDSVSTIYVDTPTDLYTLKHWIYDHNEDSDIGGLAVLGAYFCGEDSILPAASAYAGERVVISWSPPSCGHAVTIVGYCDDVKFDFNGDGQYTNGTNLEDWEIGAVKVANNYGEDWEHGNAGFIWIPYRLLALNNLASNRTYVFHVDHEYTPEILLKVKIYHPDRDNVRVSGQYAPDATYTVPVEGHHYKLINTFGGDVPMQGINEDPIEIALDFSYWFKNKDVGKIFLAVSDLYSPSPVGVVEYFSFVDYRWGEEFEIFCNELNVSITYPWIRIGINYDLIPHEFPIEEDLILFSDMVSRFMPTVTNGATLTVEDGVNIDMYNSEIHINQNASLVVEDNVTFTAKTGICKIIVDGNATIGSYVSFLTEGDAQIWLVINNTGLDLTIDAADFLHGVIIAYNDHLTVTNSSFINSGIYGFNGNFDITGSWFNSSFIHISNADGDDRLVNISGECTFLGSEYHAIEIDNYPNFTIDNCLIRGHDDAVNLYNCGYGRYDQRISNCEMYDNTNSGITVYRSSVDITNNIISGNGFGIKCFDRSVVHIEGDHLIVTQEISDNIWNEIYASRGAFPQYFHWNLVQDDDNVWGDPLVKYTGSEFNLDVRNNCWGNNFSPVTDLEPSGHYLWLPVWQCMQGGGTAGSDGDELLYLDAREFMESENFTSAKNNFEQIVAEYPESEYAKAAMKELLPLA